MNIFFKATLLIFYVLFAQFISAQQGQISIPRINTMPDSPSPYNMRDWKKVAIQYDSFIYDKDKMGQFLPLVSYTTNAINYPGQKQIKLHTYVGTKSTQNSEGINVLPSLVGAALVGQDIQNLYGVNRLRMSQDFFNKVNGENIYLNNASAGSGGDWWYDVMPNIYFYQLYDLFPNFNSEADFQFGSVANKFLEATKAMGGSASPWSAASMNFRAWNFKTMEGNANGVKEPEAAGAFSWLLYHAYKKTNNKEYLKGAEWSMEFLNSLNSNPSYELQLPYGVLAAAKMNAEIGTDYNVEKMVNWCFNRGPLRGWGTIVGTWGGFDVSGLIGEANDGGKDYAFLMNGMQQASALVPIVRYDKRFAKEIGKWMLNLSNASRLFYPGFLPGSLQDGSAWSLINDPNSIIAHEAMKQKYQNLSPFATGDALGGGWAATNLAIYGSSSVGYLGAIVSKTNVDKILQLDLNATDFYNDTPYPTYLYYNPHDTPRAVLLETGNGQYNVYETLSEKFIYSNITGSVSIIIPAKEAAIVVITPAGGTVSFDKNKMLVNEIIVDYNQNKTSFTYGPRIKALEAKSYIVEKGSSTTIYCTAEDLDSNTLTYRWNANAGAITGGSPTVTWTAPQTLGLSEIKVLVKDEEGNSDSLSIQIEVVDIINKAPVIERLISSSLYTSKGGTINLDCDASDANGDILTYTWSFDGGVIIGTGKTVDWVAPLTEGIYAVDVNVNDGKGLSDKRRIYFLVKEFNDDGQLIAYYPFMGNANDKSGNEHHGVAKGVILTADFSGKPLSSYYFNGGAQHIEVGNTPKLNFQDGITLSLWCKPVPADKETFIISHGSWQNRWKLSITPTGQLRWTINTLTRIADLDSEIIIQKDSIYHLAASYDGETMMIYINGKLNSFKTLDGKIRTTTFPLLIGQMLPSDASYNFKGIQDEIRIFDYAIHPNDVNVLFGQGIASSVNDIDKVVAFQIYPNPVRQTLHLNLIKDNFQISSISISDIRGTNISRISYKNQKEFEIDVSSLTSGNYFMSVNNNQGQIIQSIQFIKL